MSITQMTHDRRRGAVGLGLAVLSAFTFSTAGTFADALMETGWSPGAVVTFRITIAAVLLTLPAVFALRGRWGRLRASLPSVLAFGLVAIVGCQLFFFQAIERLDVGVALLLEYSGILLVVGWMWIRHGHRPRRLTVIGGVAALFGLILVLNPSGGGLDPVGVFWGLLAGCGLAFYFVTSSKADDTLPPIALAWASMVVGAFTLAVLDLAHLVRFDMSTDDVVLMHRERSWLVPVIGVSFIAAAISYAAGIGAARLLGAKLASFAGLTEVLFAILFAWLALGQAPSVGQLLGGAAVLAGIAVVRADETTEELPAPEPLTV